MMKVLERFFPLIGRILITFPFVNAGIRKVMDPLQTAGYIASKGLPVPLLLSWLAAAAELGGPLLLISGFLTRFGALILLLFLIPTTLIFHNFWALEGMERSMQMGQFLKNTALIAGLLYIITYGAGPISVDGWLSRRRQNKD